MKSQAAALLLATAASAPAIDITPFIDVLNVNVVHTDGMEFNEYTKGEVDVTQTQLFAILGLVGNDDNNPWTWVPTFNYEYSAMDVTAISLAPSPMLPRFDEDLHEITFPNFLLYNQEGSKWFHGFYNSFGLMSNFDHIDSRDFFLSAAIGSGYQFNDCFALGFGVYGSDLTNNPWIVAAPVFFWMPTEDWLISYYGPKFIARREFGPNIRVGFEGAWNGGSWNTNSPGGAYDSVQLNLSSIRTGLYYKQRIHKELWANVGVGFTFANELTVDSPGGRDLFPNSLGEMDSAPYFTIGFSVNRW